mmetsp:Transcript_13971/g.40928  ORF Transcript_13971/g.40928 Transcript_13971/m.40928 type:complete len:217 (-) Transcript_13971:713-1363(-)
MTSRDSTSLSSRCRSSSRRSDHLPTSSATRSSIFWRAIASDSSSASLASNSCCRPAVVSRAASSSSLIWSNSSKRSTSARMSSSSLLRLCTSCSWPLACLASRSLWIVRSATFASNSFRSVEWAAWSCTAAALWMICCSCLAWANSCSRRSSPLAICRVLYWSSFCWASTSASKSASRRREAANSVVEPPLPSAAATWVASSSARISASRRRKAAI